MNPLRYGGGEAPRLRHPQDRRLTRESISEQVQPPPRAVSADGVPRVGHADACRAPRPRVHVLGPVRGDAAVLAGAAPVEVEQPPRVDGQHRPGQSGVRGQPIPQLGPNPFSHGVASANLITNGDFETFVPSNGTGGGWTSSNLDGAGGWRASGGNPDEHFVLNQAGQALTDPTISQTVGGRGGSAELRTWVRQSHSHSL
jgi:hypothetical protein